MINVRSVISHGGFRSVMIGGRERCETVGQDRKWTIFIKAARLLHTAMANSKDKETTTKERYANLSPYKPQPPNLSSTDGPLAWIQASSGMTAQIAMLCPYLIEHHLRSYGGSPQKHSGVVSRRRWWPFCRSQARHRQRFLQLSVRAWAIYLGRNGAVREAVLLVSFLFRPVLLFFNIKL